MWLSKLSSVITYADALSNVQSRTKLVKIKLNIFKVSHVNVVQLSEEIYQFNWELMNIKMSTLS